jgi:hypothetical protein
LYGRVTYKHKQQSEKTWYGKKHGLLGDVQKKLSYVSVTPSATTTTGLGRGEEVD